MTIEDKTSSITSKYSVFGRWERAIVTKTYGTRRGGEGGTFLLVQYLVGRGWKGLPGGGAGGRTTVHN
jgi:hypothetical protein